MNFELRGKQLVTSFFELKSLHVVTFLSFAHSNDKTVSVNTELCLQNFNP